MLIGQIARASGASIKAIRLYEQLGLISAPPRLGKYRFYEQSSVQVLRCIKQAQGLGFSLKEMRELVDHAGEFAIDRFQHAIDKKINLLSITITQAEQNTQALAKLRQQVMQPNFCAMSN